MTERPEERLVRAIEDVAGNLATHATYEKEVRSCAPIARAMAEVVKDARLHVKTTNPDAHRFLRTALQALDSLGEEG